MIKELNKIFDEILEYAERNQVCLRKAVGCGAIGFHKRVCGQIDFLVPFTIEIEHNGPSRIDHKCTNEVGNCGCSHSEPRLVQEMLKKNSQTPLILICTYSPCTNCANIVIDSGLFSGVIFDILTEHDKRGLEFLNQAMPVMSRNQLTCLEDNIVNDKIKEWISC